MAHLGAPGVCWPRNPARLGSSTAGKLQILWICTEGGLREALSGVEGKLSHPEGTASIPMLPLISSLFISPGHYSWGCRIRSCISRQKRLIAVEVPGKAHTSSRRKESKAGPSLQTWPESREHRFPARKRMGFKLIEIGSWRMSLFWSEHVGPCSSLAAKHLQVLPVLRVV